MSVHRGLNQEPSSWFNNFNNRRTGQSVVLQVVSNTKVRQIRSSKGYRIAQKILLRDSHSMEDTGIQLHQFRLEANTNSQEKPRQITTLLHDVFTTFFLFNLNGGNLLGTGLSKPHVPSTIFKLYFPVSQSQLIT